MSSELDDVRPIRPVWAELMGLVDGARRRGWKPEQVDYLVSCLGVCWAVATHRARQRNSEERRSAGWAREGA